MEDPQSLFQRDKLSHIVSTLCTAVQTYTDPTLIRSDQSAGRKMADAVGTIFHSTEALGSALVVSYIFSFPHVKRSANYRTYRAICTYRSKLYSCQVGPAL